MNSNQVFVSEPIWHTSFSLVCGMVMVYDEDDMQAILYIELRKYFDHMLPL